MITTLKDLRAAFWLAHPFFKRRGRTKQNDYSTNIRQAWCDFVEMMHRNRQLPDKLAQKATL